MEENFIEYAESDSEYEINAKLMENTAQMELVRVKYNLAQGKLNEVFTKIYIQKLEAAKLKPDTQGIR
jgi:hypothetical protein